MERVRTVESACTDTCIVDVDICKPYIYHQCPIDSHGDSDAASHAVAVPDLRIHQITFRISDSVLRP